MHTFNFNGMSRAQYNLSIAGLFNTMAEIRRNNMEFTDVYFVAMEMEKLFDYAHIL